MARMGKKETLKLCDKLITANTIANTDRGHNRQFNAGYSHGLAVAARLLGVRETVTWRCQEIADEFTNGVRCPAAVGGGCVARCDCHKRGLTWARNDDQLLYLLGFKTWEEINQEV